MQSATRHLKRKLALKSVIKDRLAEAIRNRDWTSIEELQTLITKALDKPYNLVLLGDAYKYSHHKFYEDNTSLVYSYMESRGGRFSETVFYGLEMFMKEFIEGVAITQEELDEIHAFLNNRPREIIGFRTPMEYYYSLTNLVLLEG